MFPWQAVVVRHPSLPHPGLPVVPTVQAVAVGLLAGLALWWLGAPSPPLFGALIGGVVLALRVPVAPSVPEGLRFLGMAVVGTAAGSAVDAEVLGTVIDSPIAVLGGVLATLAVSMLVGQLLRFDRDVDARTAAFASIAGGASGVAIAAREYGADDGVVMSVQYLRVVFVLATVPAVAPLLGGVGGGSARLPEAVHDPVSQLLYTAAAIGGGLLLARLVPIPAAPVLATLVVSSGLAMSGCFVDARPPAWVLAIGFVIIGANVGLGFSRERVRRLVRLFPLALLQTALGIIACAGIGILFARATGVSHLDGYLATTPGGLPAVVAVAVDSGDAIGLILTMQFVRVFMALACAPLIGLLLRRPLRP